MRKYDIGQIIKFNYEENNGFGIIVKFEDYDNDLYLVKLLGNLCGEGHDGNGYEEGSEDYWWVRTRGIEYTLEGNKVLW